MKSLPEDFIAYVQSAEFAETVPDQVSYEKYTRVSSGQTLSFYLLDSLTDLLTGAVFMVAHPLIAREYRTMCRWQPQPGSAANNTDFDGIPFFENEHLQITEMANGQIVAEPELSKERGDGFRLKDCADLTSVYAGVLDRNQWETDGLARLISLMTPLSHDRIATAARAIRKKEWERRRGAPEGSPPVMKPPSP